MADDKKKILIVGSGAVSSALAKILKQNQSIEEIFVAPSNGIDSDIYKKVDLREDDLTGLLKFVLDNEIDLTIPVSEKSLKSDIVSFFQENGQNIFGATAPACKIALNKAYGKRFLYKIHAQTAKFGIFDKQQVAEDWLKTANFPVLIRCSEANSHGDRLVCPTMSLAREFLDNLFSKGENEILIEEYTYGHNFTAYYITDGYSAIPICAVGNYKFTSDGDGGFLTNGVGAFAPDYKVSEVVFSRLENIIKNTLCSLDKRNTPYLGILGIDCTLTDEDKFVVNEFRSFLQDFDATVVLRLVEDDLIKIFYACIEGLFADEYNIIKTNDYASVSAVVWARQYNKVIKGLDIIDDINDVDFIDVKQTSNGGYLTEKGDCFVLTRTASTLSRAKDYLYEDLNQIKFDGIRYRSDICK